MLVKRQSRYSGKVHEMEIDVTPEQMADWSNGQLIQRAMPDLTAAEREFIMTGITQAEWTELFYDEEGDRNHEID